MNKFQPFKFNNLEEFYNHLPKNELEIVLFLDDLVKEVIPDINVKLSYNVPFYFKKRNICLIWPGSVPWGKSIKPGVELAFSKGFLLNDANNYLDRGNRKQIFFKMFYSIEDIDVNIVKELLGQAFVIDMKLK